MAYWRSGGTILFAVGIGKIVSLVWKLILARFGPQTLGTVELALTVFTVVSSLALMGFHTALLRFVSIADTKGVKRVSSTLVYFSLRIVVALGLLLVALFLSQPQFLTFILRASLPDLGLIQKYLWIAPLFAVSELLWSYLAAIKQILPYATTKYILHPSLRLLVLLIGLAVGVPLKVLLVSHLAVAAIGTVAVSLWQALRFDSFIGQVIPRRQAREFLLFAAPMNASFLSFAVYGALDVILVAHFWGTDHIGLLAALVTLSDVPDMLLVPLLNILQAYLGDSYTNVRRGLSFVMSNILLFLAMALILGLAIFLIRQPLVAMLFGDQYSNITVFVGWFLIVKILQSAIILPLRHFLDFYGHVRLTFFLMIFSLGVKFVVGVSTIAAFGLAGVVAAQASGVSVHLAGCIAATWWAVHADRKKRSGARGVV
jgi:O-antigen/teichoic acid export membrane protein